jgi:hypothetical protein
MLAQIHDLALTHPVFAITAAVVLSVIVLRAALS